MAQPTDYPITCPFGWVTGYPLNQTDPAGHPGQGFHNGIDYGYPYGTPAIVNGVQIGLTGDTGAPGQPHLHVGKWIGGQVQNPGQYNGFTFQSAEVTEIHPVNDSVNGKYVRVQADGASWVYLHLSAISVKVGDKLVGGNMPDYQAIAVDASKYKTGVVDSKGWADPTVFSGSTERITPAINNLIDDRNADSRALGIPLEADAAARIKAIGDLKAQIKLLSDDRDKNLYPFVLAVTQALGIKNDTNIKTATDAINALKTSGLDKAAVIAYINKNLN